MKIMLCGGGTGGHVNPAIAIAARLKEVTKNPQISFVGTSYGIESTLVPKAGYPISFVKVKGFKRSLSFSNIDAAIKAATSVWAAKKIIKKFDPDIVIGTGGYVSWPTVKAASKMGIPTIIHEQNALPGVTTKMLAKYADRICISFDESRKHFDKESQQKIILTGNPINTEEINDKDARERLSIPSDIPYVLSYGGSMGAERINKLIFDMIEEYSIPNEVYHTHGVGRIGFEYFSALAREKGFADIKKIDIKEFIFDMPDRQAAADIVISRAGAITLAELAYRRKVAILIPSPNVTDNHQYKNAKVLEDAGAAILLQEADLTAEKLIEAVDSLLNDSKKRESLMENISLFSKPQAVSAIADIALELTGN